MSSEMPKMIAFIYLEDNSMCFSDEEVAKLLKEIEAVQAAGGIKVYESKILNPN